MEKFKHLEFLSKLKIEEDEKLKSDFDKMLEFVDEIKELKIEEDLKGDEGIFLKELRTDEIKPSYPRDVILKNAPKQKDGCFSAPLVVE